MLIDPIDSVRLIQSLQARSLPAPFTSHPCKPPFIFLCPTHTYTHCISPVQYTAYKYIFHRSWNSHLLYSCPLMATHCSVMGIFVVSSNIWCLMRSFICLSNCNAMRGWPGYMTCHMQYSNPTALLERLALQRQQIRLMRAAYCQG